MKIFPLFTFPVIGNNLPVTDYKLDIYSEMPKTGSELPIQKKKSPSKLRKPSASKLPPLSKPLLTVAKKKKKPKLKNLPRKMARRKLAKKVARSSL